MSSKIQNGLSVLVADGTVFYQKLRHYHWHVKGDRFFMLHEKFEEMYDRWAEIIDETAERIVSQGGTAPHTLEEIIKLAKLREDAEVPGPEVMVENLGSDLKTLVTSMDQLAAEAEKEGDRVTTNLLEDFRDEQTKTLWMLRSFLA